MAESGPRALKVQGFRNNHALVLIDGMSERQLSFFGWLMELATQRDWLVVISVGSEILFDALSKKAQLADAGFYELSHWGPSRIREFVTKYFEGTEIDIDAAYNFVSTSLEDTDIPATPWVVALYLSIFPTLGKQVSSLSFVRLLEKIEEHRLGQVETSSVDSLYNKRQILMRLACVCLDRHSICVDRATLEQMVESFFRDRFLKVDAQKFLSSLHESGLVVVNSEGVRFSYFAFYDYFLARAFERKLQDPNTILTSLSGCLSIGHALSLYGGLFRENIQIAKTLLGHVGSAFSANQVFLLRDLEKYINDLLLEHDSKSSADAIVNTDLQQRIDYEAYGVLARLVCLAVFDASELWRVSQRPFRSRNTCQQKVQSLAFERLQRSRGQLPNSVPERSVHDD